MPHTADGGPESGAKEEREGDAKGDSAGPAGLVASSGTAGGNVDDPENKKCKACFHSGSYKHAGVHYKKQCICYRCRGTDHISSQCPRKKKS